MSTVNIMCYGCGATGSVDRVTAGLQCRCGSKDLDLYTGTPEQKTALHSLRVRREPVYKMAPPYTAGTITHARMSPLVASLPSFVEWMTKQASPTKAPLVSGNVQGWNEYTGPMPGPSGESNGVGTPITCPVCHGYGFDLQEGGTCRECHGEGKITPNTEAEAPAVARHEYPSSQTKVPFMGKRKSGGRKSTDPMGSPEEYIKETTPGYGVGPDDSGMYPKGQHSPMVQVREQRDYSQPPKGPFEMPGAFCPNCGQEPTHLKKDYKDDAWWTCPNCGPLANIDRHPEIDPYNVKRDFKPNPSSYRESKKFGGRKTGRLLKLVAVIRQSNPGLTPREVLGLGRKTVTYAENR